MSSFCSCLLTLPISGRHWMGVGWGGGGGRDDGRDVGGMGKRDGGGHATNNFSKALYDSGLTV